MMLPRKRQRPNPTESPAASGGNSSAPAAPRPESQAASSSTSDTASSIHDQQMPPPSVGSAKTGQSALKQIRKTQSWYDSWPRPPRAPASTSVVRENIFGGSVRAERAPDLSRFEPKKDIEAGSIRSNTHDAPALSRTSHSGMDDGAKGKEQQQEPGQQMDTDDKTTPETSDIAKNDASAPNSHPDPATPQRPTTSSGWRGWWSKTPVTDAQGGPPTQPPQTEPSTPDAGPPPSTPAAETNQGDTDTAADTPDPPRSASWFGFWSSSNTPVQSKPGQAGEGVPGETQAKSSEDVDMKDPEPPAQQKPEPAPKAGSTWAFWSKDSPRTKGAATSNESGEIAVIGEGSEAHPKPMTEDDVTPSKDTKNKKEGQTGGVLTWRRNDKRVRPPSIDIEPPSPSPSGTSTPREEPALPQPPSNAKTQTQPKVATSSKSVAESETAAKPQSNLLLPSFTSTYQMKQDPSIIKQIARLVLRAQEPPVNHVFRVKEPPKIRKAIAIGVHGLFPATYLRPMIGQPTGTSLRFASLGAEAIRRWADGHGSPECEIEKVALEGEGKINERVENLWTLMLNWIDHIRQADLVLIACHSQGVPVSVMLLEKLIDLGIITNAKIGVCAMAGVALGPFPEYKSGILIGSAAELWEFGNTESTNSQRFEASLKRVLGYGARITFVGSIDDQLVPMESAIYSPANHPYIYRAVFIDGRVHAPDFISHLVGFALKLRNLGISDHGLIRELSLPLAGSLYSGEGHSRLYYDDQVYDLAVSHALETTSARGQKHPDCEIRHRGQGLQQPGQPPNPYILPWIMRGLLEEEFVRTELSEETEELLRQFDAWRPANKALKDVKYRLEAVRSKL